MRIVTLCLIAAASIAGAGVATAAPASRLAAADVAPQVKEASPVENVHWRKKRRYHRYAWRPRVYGFYSPYYRPYYYRSYYYPTYYYPYYSRPYRRSGLWIGFRF
jgi:hypothetical protein